jgi:hypothetical protein
MVRGTEQLTHAVTEPRPAVAAPVLSPSMRLREGRRFLPDLKPSGPLQLAALIVVVALQVWVNYHEGRISDLSKLYFVHHLHSHPWPYLGVRIEYPVLTGIYMTAAAAVTNGLHGYMVISSLGLLACAIGCVCTLWRIDRLAAYCFALSPLLLVYSLLNWDLLAMVLMLLGWQAWARGRYSLSALWLTLGTFAKLYPVFLLLFCGVELARRVHECDLPRSQLARFAGTAAVVTLAVNLPFALPAFHNWLYFWSFSEHRNEQADLLAWLGLLRHASIGTANMVLTSVVLVAIAAGVVAVWRRQPLGHIAALVFFVFMTMQKIYSPQYTLWLLAYALVAGWEPWAIGVLSLMGLGCYANAVIHISLVAHHPATERWFDSYIGPAQQGERLLTTLAVAFTAALRASRRQRRARLATAVLSNR